METDTIRLLPMSVEDLTRDLRCHGEEPTASSSVLLVDVRPNAQFCNGHIESAENVNFSNILLRRLLKGVVSLESLLPSSEMTQKIIHSRTSGEDNVADNDTSNESEGTESSRQHKLIVYDWCSNEEGVKVELAKHAEVLATANNSEVVYFLNGGYDAFSVQFPNLCGRVSTTQLQSSRRNAPLGISVSTSLPVGFSSYQKRVASQRPPLTPSEDDGNRFGPPVEVLPFMVLGCAKDSADLTQLRKMGITAILNVSHNCPNHFESLFEYKCIPVQDSHQADLLSMLETAFDFINYIKEKKGRVFVHCHAGISRSATVCIAYIMKHHQKDLTQAYDFVKQRRPCISPNLHFMGQLLEFQKRLQPAAVDTSSDGNNQMEEMDCDSEHVFPTPLPKKNDEINFTAQSAIVSVISPGPEPGRDVLLCSPGYQIPVSIPHQQPSDCSSTRGSKRSVSVPGSLNFTLAKPKRKTLCAPPKFPVKYNQALMEFHCSTDSALHSHSASTMTSRPTKLNLTSISLPSTPVNQSKHHLSFSSRLRVTQGLTNTRLVRQSSLQLSPCRVVAAKNWDTHNGQSLDLSPVPTMVPTTIAM